MIDVKVARVTLPKGQTYVKIMSARARARNRNYSNLFLLASRAFISAYDQAILQK